MDVSLDAGRSIVLVDDRTGAGRFALARQPRTLWEVANASRLGEGCYSGVVFKVVGTPDTGINSFRGV